MLYNLEKRLSTFSMNILKTIKWIRLTYLNKNIIEQLLRSWTSIWANYHEANGASSKKDFRNKIYLCRKESQETHYWIWLLIGIEEAHEKELTILLKESKELLLIFNKISHTLKEKTKDT